MYWDPFDPAIARNPYPIYQQLRSDAPLWYNEKHDFWVLSRWEDVNEGLGDWQTYSSAKGPILEVIKANIEIPPGTLLMEDPPAHDIHRRLLSRVFTPRRVASLEDAIRDYCVRCLDRLDGSDSFDLMTDLANEVPMRVIGMLLGIPEEDQLTVRERADAKLRTEPGKQMKVSADALMDTDLFANYIDWRADHPSDDLMTELLNAEFEDEHGVTRTLTRAEILTYVTVLAGAGNETTARLIGWLVAVLARHPDQRADLLAHRELVPNVIEETLRYEPTGHAIARYVTRDVQVHGQKVPQGSAMMLMIASANRDETKWENPNVYDIRRPNNHHVTFGLGVHFCMGAALARLEGQIALDEFTKRYSDWEIDWDNAALSSTSTMRGWETLPISVR
jgi:cytochrome P450